MNDEVQSPRVKTIKRKTTSIGLGLGSTFIVLFCAFLIVISTFVQLDIIHFVLPFKIFSGENVVPADFIHSYKLIPQVPAVIFVAAFLGRKYGIASVLIYILVGLFIIPIFALGGGPKYVFEYGFGYILAFIPAVFFTGSILKSGYSFRNIAQAVLVGVLTVHVIGVLYMLFIAGIKHEGLGFIGGWISSQSGIKIVYDYILSFFAVLIAKYARILLWFYVK